MAAAVSAAGCYVTLIGTMLFGLLGFMNQLMLRDPAALEALEEPGCYRRWLKRVWLFMKVWAEPIFTLNQTLIDIGDPDITPEGEAAAVKRFRDSLFKMFAFFGNVGILACSATLLVSTIELFVMGVYSRTANMTFLGVLLGFLSLAVALITLVGITAHLMPDGHRSKRFRTKLFLLFAFIAVPCCGFMSLLCFTLGSNEYVNVPWVSEFIGLSSENLESESSTTNEGGASWDSPTNEDVAMIAGEVEMLRSQACPDPRIACSVRTLNTKTADLLLCFLLKFCSLCLKPIVLPRQAWDKRQEN